jgi:hypothetical protein
LNDRNSEIHEEEWRGMASVFEGFLEEIFGESPVNRAIVNNMGKSMN